MHDSDFDREERAYLQQEVRAYRDARRQGFALRKSRSRDPNDPTYSMFHITDPFTNTIVAGGHTNNGYDMNLDEVTAWLAE